jgi:hypothetical protein
MPNSRSPAAYDEQRMYLDNALANPDGLELEFDSIPIAANWLGRCHSYRALMRDRYYASDDPLFGTTPWDKLRIGRKGRKVYITPIDAAVRAVKNPRTGAPAYVVNIDALDKELTSEKSTSPQKRHFPVPKTVQEELAALPEEERKQIEAELTKSIFD